MKGKKCGKKGAAKGKASAAPRGKGLKKGAGKPGKARIPERAYAELEMLVTDGGSFAQPKQGQQAPDFKESLQQAAKDWLSRKPVEEKSSGERSVCAAAAEKINEQLERKGEGFRVKPDDFSIREEMGGKRALYYHGPGHELEKGYHVVKSSKTGDYLLLDGWGAPHPLRWGKEAAEFVGRMDAKYGGSLEKSDEFKAFEREMKDSDGQWKYSKHAMQDALFVIGGYKDERTVLGREVPRILEAFNSGDSFKTGEHVREKYDAAVGYTDSVAPEYSRFSCREVYRDMLNYLRAIGEIPYAEPPKKG